MILSAFNLIQWKLLFVSDRELFSLVVLKNDFIQNFKLKDHVTQIIKHFILRKTYFETDI